MSAGFPKMVWDMRGRFTHHTDYVRLIWEQYNHYPVKITAKGLVMLTEKLVGENK